MNYQSVDEFGFNLVFIHHVASKACAKTQGMEKANVGQLD